MTELKGSGFHEFALARHVDSRYLQAVNDFLDLYSKGRAKYHDLIQLFSVEETTGLKSALHMVGRLIQ